MSILPAGTVTFLFTDIESSSGRWESRPDEMALVLSRHDELLREAVARHGGVVFKHLGDGLCAAFASAPAAMSAAIAGQAALQAGPWPGSGAPAVRMGLHSGDANPLGDDYFGPAVNRAARIMAVANGGQIVCSAATAELCRTAGLRDAGVHQLRGVGAERLHLVVDGYAVDSRPLRTASIVGNLHRPPTSFVGREGMTERLGSELARSRLVTLTGPGGVGKTRMAVETAWSSAGEYPDGAWLCELAPVADPDSVALAVASILALRLQEGLDAVDAVADGLAQRQLLLVLDNCEHVLGAAAGLAEAILARAPRVTVLATSREPLTVAGERVWPVPPLDASVGGVQLFVDRAMAADGRFDPAANGDAMEEICSRLDGIPFAIELAAARVRALTPSDLAARLGDRFRLLSGGRRHGLGRHQTLRATVDWSYQLLDPAEQLLFDRLAVMAGSFDLAAAEAIGSDDVVADDGLDLLASLVDKSMIVAHTGGRHTRYQLLETLRQFGEEHLLASGELARCRARHLDHYLEAARRARDEFEGLSNREGAARFEADWDNLRAALAWAVAEGEADKATALVVAPCWYAFWGVRHELGDWAEQVLALSGAGVEAYGVAALIAHHRDDEDRSIEAAEAGLRLAGWTTEPATAAVWAAAALHHYMSGRLSDTVDCAKHVEEASAGSAMALATALEMQTITSSVTDADVCTAAADRLRKLAIDLANPTIEAVAAYAIAVALSAKRDFTASLAAYERGLALAESTETWFVRSQSLIGIAMVTARLNADDTSVAYLSVLTELYRIRDWGNTSALFESLAASWVRNGEVEAAVVLIGHLESLNRRPASFLRMRERTLRVVRAHPDAEALLARGAGLDRDQVVAFAREQLASTTPPE